MLLKAYVNEIDNALEKDKKVGEVLKKIIYKILFWFNYVLYFFSHNEGGLEQIYS